MKDFSGSHPSRVRHDKITSFGGMDERFARPARGSRSPGRALRPQPRHPQIVPIQRGPGPAGVPRSLLHAPRLGHGQPRRATPRPTRTSSTRTPSRSAAHTKAPDYCFRIGGTRKFFVEAKKPSVNIKDDAEPGLPAPPLRLVAPSCPSRILTDFEEFAVYDCRIKPAQTDKACDRRASSTSPTRDYAERVGRASPSVFSREAVLKGSFDKYAESEQGASAARPRWTPPSSRRSRRWRDELARNLALRNPSLTTRELNFAVQRTIDRIIFLRICEDRGIEDYGRLRALHNGTDVYPRLCELFQRGRRPLQLRPLPLRAGEGPRRSPRRAHPEPRHRRQGRSRTSSSSLYYPDSPYEFSVLPADILGQVYEQFLGKVIRLTAGHQAKVEEKPEVKKAGGVYYTPTYIVDYIVENTVGKLLEGKTPEAGRQSSRILDPACGSGSFLIGAYQYLLDWHRDLVRRRRPREVGQGRRSRASTRPAAATGSSPPPSASASS